MSADDEGIGASAPQPILRLRPEAIAWRAVEGEIVALDIEQSEYVATNESGAAVWQALAEGASIEQLVNLLVDRFEVDLDRARADVEAFVNELRARNYLR